MRKQVLTAAVALAVGVAIPLASPAVGQTQQQIDQAFLTAVRDKGVGITDDGQALELAHKTCDLLNDGGSIDDAVKLIQKTEKQWSKEDVVSFGGLALYAYCREYLPQ